MIDRRSILGCGIAVVAGAFTPARAQAQPKQELLEAARKEGKMVWYDSIRADEARAISQAFEAKYPGIKIEYVEMVAAQRVSRIIQESRAGGPTADFFTYFPQVIMSLANQDMIRKMDWALAGMKPTAEQVPNPYLLLTHAVPYVLLTNSRKVSDADVPTTLADILKPRWKGNIGLWSVGGAFLELLANWPEQQVLEFAKGIGALSPRLYTSPRALTEAVGAGELDLGAFVPQATISEAISRGAPVRVTWLEPVPVTVVYGAVPKMGRNPNAAQLFMSWIVSDGVQIWEKEASRGNPTVTGTQLSAALRNRTRAQLPIGRVLSESERLNSISTAVVRSLQGK